VSEPPADGYERRIGRYGAELADALIGAAGIRSGMRVLDVGCGGGALTIPLAELVGPDNVAAVDPDADATTRCARRLPGVDVRVAYAEALPYSGGEFGAVLAQLLVTLVDDAPQVVAEMMRVARGGGTVATCVWDFAGEMKVLREYLGAESAVG
jgi:ubiquinone/menaquinone biosynthesis C-methylase UbiE